MEALDDIYRRLYTVRLTLKRPAGSFDEVVRYLTKLQADIYTAESAVGGTFELDSQIAEYRALTRELRMRLVTYRAEHAKELRLLQYQLLCEMHVERPNPNLAPYVEMIRESRISDIGATERGSELDMSSFAASALNSEYADFRYLAGEFEADDAVFFDSDKVLGGFRADSAEGPVRSEGSVLRLDPACFYGSSVLIRARKHEIVDLCGCILHRAFIESGGCCRLVDACGSNINLIHIGGAVDFLRVSAVFSSKISGFSGYLIVQK